MDNIIQLDAVRIERHKPRKCTCKIRKFTLDTENREVVCSCGLTVDPFEAILYLAEHYERVNEDHRRMSEQRQEWAKEKPWSKLFKGLERMYQRGDMAPICPKCEQAFDIKNLTRWVNAKLFLRR